MIGAAIAIELARHETGISNVELWFDNKTQRITIITSVWLLYYEAVERFNMY